jgi:uncharacterized protein YdhG (YjbR/CyaY superfamily)
VPQKPVAATSVENYIEQIPEPRRGAIKKLHAAIKKAVPKLKPSIQYGMIGYGTYIYKYANGKEGNAPVIALASQKNYISVYVSGAEKDRGLLPKASIGKSCIRFRKLEDIDLAVLTKMIQASAQRRLSLIG